MRLKTYSAHSLTEAMAQVRRELGPDAVIVATGDAPGGGVEVRAAAEGPRFGEVSEAPRARSARQDGAVREARGDGAAGTERIARALAFHRAPEHAVEALSRVADTVFDGEPTAALAAAIEARYAFRPLAALPDRAVLFAGPPGAGKTAALARCAARAVSAGARPRLIAADAQRAGAEARLAALAERIGADFAAIDDPRELERTLADAEPAAVTLIDAPAVNPFDLDDLDMVLAFAEAADAEILPVFDAGMDACDAEDAAAMFAAIGAARLIAAKLDCTRRLGALIGLGESGLAYAQISANPYIGASLAPASPLRLARAILDERDLPEEPAEEASE